MKILFFAPYITLKGYAEFLRNQTGLGYMVWDIARSIGISNSVDLFLTDSRGKSVVVEDVNILERSYYKILKNVFRALSPLVLYRLWKKYKLRINNFLRLVYYWLLTGYLHDILKEGKYDIVHIHGCNFATELMIRVCERKGQKYIVTLHGLNSFSNTVKQDSCGKRYERDFLRRVIERDIPITVISTGIKRRIEKEFGLISCSNINVICNSFAFKKEIKKSANIREKYGIPKEGKILLYIGNISKNKNQIQMVHAFSLLPEDVRNNTWVLFCGRPDMSFEKLIRQNPHVNHFVLCGTVDKEDLIDYYKEANGVVLLSFAEGFGLSLIEGMHFGLPCAMFSDMDAFDDIYDPLAVIPIDDRSNDSVAHALSLLLNSCWDMNLIHNYSKKFESDSMAQNYIRVYKEVTNS